LLLLHLKLSLEIIFWKFFQFSLLWMFSKCDIFNSIFSFGKIKNHMWPNFVSVMDIWTLFCFVEGVVWECPHCHDVKSTCLTKVLVFDKCIALKIPKHVSGIIGSLLNFKKLIDNGVALYESISADSDVHIFIPVGNTRVFYWRLWHFISVLYWKTQVLLLATFLHRSC
jgi:hypothetical protein